MKKNFMDLCKIGVMIPALVLSMAACAGSGSSGAGSTAEAATKDTQATEKTAETQDSQTEEAKEMVYENKGLKMTIPAEYANKVIVKVPEQSEDGVLFEVSEKASVEAAKAAGNEYAGAGWLFAICERNEEQFREMLCGDSSGEDPIGYDGNGTYYVFYHPTDVRYERETPEQMQADQEEWSNICDWAYGMKKAFIDENSGITAFNWNQTVLESYLARTAYDSKTAYVLRSLEFEQGGDLVPNDKVDAEKYFNELREGATFEQIEGEAPDGEYIVLYFPVDDVRFDFFNVEEGKNLVRQVWGEYEQLYKVTYEDSSKTANDIMHAWAQELAENK